MYSNRISLSRLIKPRSGLDARYMISQLKPENVKVLSLTTIATPHRGSAFADHVFERIGRKNASLKVSQTSINIHSFLHSETLQDYGKVWVGDRGLLTADEKVYDRGVQS